jgi:hypothetical protein
MQRSVVLLASGRRDRQYSVPLAYFFYGQQYYLFAQGIWFAATAMNRKLRKPKITRLLA